MHDRQEAPRRSRSPLLAAVLSLIFPGLGQLYVGAPVRALAFAAPPILVFALTLGVVVRLDTFELAGIAAQSIVLNGVFVLNLAALVYRAVAVFDAWRLAHWYNALAAGGGGRTGRPRVSVHPISILALAVVLVVTSGVHVAVARYDLIAISSADCLFDPECQRGTPSPSSSGPAESPDESEPPTESLPPVGTPLATEAAIPPWNGTDRLNILLIGADEQGGGHNTDTMITVSIDPVTKRVAMFTLPRDTVDVPIPAGPARNIWGRVYRGKINSFFVQARNRPDAFPGTDQTRGYNALKATLGELYGLDIKYYVEVNFDGFKRVVDTFGGVTVNVQAPVLDDHYPLANGRLARVYIPSGVQHMTGEQALVYARSRHESTDFDRGQRQQRIILSMRQQIDIASILPRLEPLAEAFTSAVRTDFPRELLPQFLGLVDEIDTGKIQTYVFTPPRYQQEILSGDSRGYVIIPNVDRIRTTVKNAFTADPEEEDRREAISGEGATVWVVNGSGVSGQAAGIAQYLDWLGLSASAPTTKPEATKKATTIVAYNGAEDEAPKTAAALAALFGVTVTAATDPSIPVDFVVTTGTATPSLTPPPGQ